MTKIKISIIVTLILNLCSVTAKQIDTLKVSEEQFITIKKYNEKCFYIQNNKVHIQCPDTYGELIDNRLLKKSSPYYLKVFYDKGYTKLKSEGMAIAFSWIGEYKEYHKNGKISKTGQYLFLEKKAETESRANIEIGEWFIYDSTGKQKTIEHWENGIYKGEKVWEDAEIWDIEIFVNNKLYSNESSDASKLASIDIKLKTKDQNMRFGRYDCRLVVTGGKMPIKMFMMDYLSLEYFNFQKFIADFWKPNSNLFIEITDTKTGQYYSTTFNLN